jgi:hypothetical protein
MQALPVARAVEPPASDVGDGWASALEAPPAPAPVAAPEPESVSTSVGPAPEGLAEAVAAPTPASPPDDGDAFQEEGSGTPPPEPEPIPYDPSAEVTQLTAAPSPEEEVFAAPAPPPPPVSTEGRPAPQGPVAMVQGVGIGLPGGRLRQVFAAGSALPAHWNKRMPGARATGVLDLEVHESPSERASDGHLLGKVSIKPPRKEQGVEWQLDFQVDADAVLKVVLHPADTPDSRTERLYALENTTPRGRARVARSQPKDPEGGGGGFMRRLMGR